MNKDLLTEAIMDSLDCAGVDISREQAEEAAGVLEVWLENMSMGGPDLPNFEDREIKELKATVNALREERFREQQLTTKALQRHLGTDRHVYVDKDGYVCYSEMR